MSEGKRVNLHAENSWLDPEIVKLMAAQSKAVMPLIGPLIDAWDCLPNDQRSGLPGLAKVLNEIDKAMEGRS